MLTIRENAPNFSKLRQNFFNFLKMRQKLPLYFGNVSKSDLDYQDQHQNFDNIGLLRIPLNHDGTDSR